MWRAFGMRSVICMCCLVEWAWLCLLSPAVRSPLSYTTARWGFESAWTRFAVICHCLGKVSEWEVTYDFILLSRSHSRFGLLFIHYISLFSWFPLLLKRYSKMFLGGISLDDGSKVGMLLSTFWEIYRHTHSDHVVYTIHQGVLTLKEVYTITTWINFVNPSYSSMLFSNGPLSNGINWPSMTHKRFKVSKQCHSPTKMFLICMFCV